MHSNNMPAAGPWADGAGSGNKERYDVHICIDISTSIDMQKDMHVYK